MYVFIIVLKSTSNYLARRFGVRAAMPGFIAKKLCPNLIIVPLNFDKYREVSKEVCIAYYETITSIIIKENLRFYHTACMREQNIAIVFCFF